MKIRIISLALFFNAVLGLRSPVILHAQLQPDQVQRSVIDDSTNYCADAGSSDTYACNLTPPPAAYVTGARYRIRANTANTGAATVNFNSLGARTIKKWVSGTKSDLATGDIGVNQVVDFVYDGTDMVATSLGGGGGAGGGVSGLTTDKIPKAASATTLADSAFTESTNDITSSKNLIIGACTTNCLAHDTSAITGIKVPTWPNRSGSVPLVSDNTTGAIPAYWDLDLAAVIGGAASHVWNDDPLSTACTPTAVVGTNRGTAVCNFADTDGAKGRQITRWLPIGFQPSLGLDAIIWWKTTGSGNAVFQVATKCYGDDEADDATFNASSSVTAAAGTSGRPNVVTLSGITITDCDATDMIRIRFFRDRGHLSDTLNAALDVEKVIFKYRYVP